MLIVIVLFVIFIWVSTLVKTVFTKPKKEIVSVKKEIILYFLKIGLAILIICGLIATATLLII